MLSDVGRACMARLLSSELTLDRKWQLIRASVAIEGRSKNPGHSHGVALDHRIRNRDMVSSAHDDTWVSCRMPPFLSISIGVSMRDGRALPGYCGELTGI